MNLVNDLRTNYKTVSQNEAFWQEMHATFLRSSRAAAGAVMVMLAVTIAEDWFTHHDLFLALLLAKLLSIAALATALFLSHVPWGRRHVEAIFLSLVFVIIIASMYQATLMREPYLLAIVAVFTFMISATMLSWPLHYHVGLVAGLIVAVWTPRFFVNTTFAPDITGTMAATLMSLISIVLAHYMIERRFALWQARASLREKEEQARQRAHALQQARATLSTVLNNLDALI